MGIYLVQFASLVYGGEVPETIEANGILLENGDIVKLDAI